MYSQALTSIRYFACSLLLALLLACFCTAQSGGLKGKVRTNAGDGIANASVTAAREGRDIKSAKSVADGSFEIKGLDPGFYTIRVEASGYSTGTRPGIEVKNKMRDLGDRLFLRVDQGTQVILRGSVFFKEGTSVTRAKVELEKVNADGSFKRIGSAETDVSGEFIFRQPDGAARYRITAKYNGVTGAKEISVENAAVYRLAITLPLSSADK